MTRQCEVTPPTTQKAIDNLVDQGILTGVTGQKRNRVSLSPGIMDAAPVPADEQTSPDLDRQDVMAFRSVVVLVVAEREARR